MFSGSFGHRTLLRAHGNDQRSLASVEAYGNGAGTGKSAPFRGSEQAAQASWSPLSISARSAVFPAGGAVTFTGLL
jgi:hypothetical protein